MDNDDMFEGMQDPYDRLNEMEAGLINHADHITQLGQQLKQFGEHQTKISENLKELARVNWHLTTLVRTLELRVEELEKRNEIN